MKMITTRDGSPTFFHELLNEHYHSLSGAAKEAREKFVRPSNVMETARTGEVVLLDVCFGLGYNTAAAIDLIQQSNPLCRINVYGFEIDRDILKQSARLKPPFDCWEMVQKAARSSLLEHDTLKIRIFIGDVREQLMKVPDGIADAVFFDPFSPQKVPYMWTGKFLKDIFQKMRADARLTTYSCAGTVRRALKHAGFEVMDGPSIGRRSPSTVGVKPGNISEGRPNEPETD